MLSKIASEFPSVGWNIFSVGTDSLSLVRPRTQQWRISRDKSFSSGQMKIQNTNLLVSLLSCKGENKKQELCKVSINMLIFWH